jgi:hypothetical protein
MSRLSEFAPGQVVRAVHGVLVGLVVAVGPPEHPSAVIVRWATTLDTQPVGPDQLARVDARQPCGDPCGERGRPCVKYLGHVGPCNPVSNLSNRPRGAC